MVPPPSPATDISIFHEGTLFVNPNLTNGTGGFFTAETNGGSAGHSNEINGSVNPILLNPRSDTGQYAVHIYGTQTDTSPTGYPSMELFCFLRNDPADSADPYIYDVSSFTGIQFDTLVAPDDNNPARWFEVGITLNTPAATNPGGTCQPPFSSNCYNYFYQNMPGPSASWQHVTAPFSGLAIRFAAGDGLAGPLTGSKVVNGQTVFFKTQVLFLLWQFSNNGNSATTYTDYWVDNVEFY